MLFFRSIYHYIPNLSNIHPDMLGIAHINIRMSNWQSIFNISCVIMIVGISVVFLVYLIEIWVQIYGFRYIAFAL